MTLEMRPFCEKCGAGVTPEGVAYICTYECTFCEACTKAMDHHCPNCGGELVRRPRKKT